MSLKDLQKNVTLEKYSNIEIPELQYDNELTLIEIQEDVIPSDDSTSESSTIDTYEKLRTYSNKIIKFYMSEEKRLALYKELFNTEDIDEVSDEMMLEMTKLISFENLLSRIDEDKLDLYAKDNKIPLKSSRKKQEEIIVYTITKKAEKKS